MTISDEPTTPEAEAPAPAEADSENSMYPAPVETMTRVERKPRKPKPREPYAVVGGGDTDEVLHSRAVPLERAKTRKSLTIHHLQRRLTELGFPEAGADLDGRWGALTGRAVTAWQEKNGHEPTGELTGPQFLDIFSEDINVTAVVDTPAL